MELSYLLDAQPNVYKHMIGYATSAAVRAAIQLRIPTIISEHRSPMSLQALAAATEIAPAKANSLYRLMRLLENAGFVALAIDQGEERYKLTPSSELLIEGKTPCVGPFFDLMHHKAVLSPLGSLADWLKEDGTRTPFDFTHGATLWDYIENNSKFKGVADRAMDCDSETLSLGIGRYKTVFEGAKTVVDVGGGRGDLAKIIVQEFPDVRCTVLDLPHVVAGLRGGENLEFKSGDMFKHVPPADVVMLKVHFFTCHLFFFFGEIFINHHVFTQRRIYAGAVRTLAQLTF